MSQKKIEKIHGIDILTTTKIAFYNPLKGVYTARLPISGCAWIDTDEGIVLIDTMINKTVARKVREKIKDPIKFIIYTHGHVDHIGGTEVFLEDNPEIIANKYLKDRINKYKILARHRARISAIQFNIPEIVRDVNFIYPTKLISGEMTFRLGNKTFELYCARAETDDVCWVYIPELECAFIGDLMIGSFPNIGNPWKPTRFALDWAMELEKVRAKYPKYVFCNGAGIMYKGKKAIDALDANIEVIRALHDQVVGFINQGIHISEMIHKVKIPDNLKNNPYLRTLYSRPEFFTYNVYRWYHGYFDNNPAHLLPRPEKEIMNEIYNLIGEPLKIINRSKELLSKNQVQLGLELLDVLIQAHPENLDARKLRIELLEELGKEDYCLMSRNAWYYFIIKDKEFIKKNSN
ncbi:MAG: alkyl sulfatase dimerization domain-containing protein [Candidatus Thorarchaeota archaeon]